MTTVRQILDPVKRIVLIWAVLLGACQGNFDRPPDGDADADGDSDADGDGDADGDADADSDADEAADADADGDGACPPACPECDAECGGRTCICADGCECLLSCAGGACGIECTGAGTRCTADAADASGVSPFLCGEGAQCVLDFSGGSNMSETAWCYGDGTSCDVNCEDASECALSCNGGAECLLRCSGASSCGFSPCAG